MTLADVQRLFTHWRSHPPLRHLVRAVAASLGVKLPDGEADKQHHMTAEEAMALKRLTGGKIDGIGSM